MALIVAVTVQCSIGLLYVGCHIKLCNLPHSRAFGLSHRKERRRKNKGEKEISLKESFHTRDLKKCQGSKNLINFIIRSGSSSPN